LLSNTTAISPTDIWKLSDTHIKPQLGKQVSIGFYKDFPKQSLETSLEVYYKSIGNFLDYKSGAQIVMNKQIERDVLTTKGKAYGAEVMIKKTSGKLNGWMSYAYSRILLTMDDPIAGQTINKGNAYPANFDKPHAVNVVGNYKFTPRYALSLNVQYSTGRPITLPIAIFDLAGSQRVLYSERNQYRVPDYFRTDISFNIEGNHRVKQKTHNSWSLGVYNMTGRRNPYSIYFVEENGKIKGYKLSVIGAAIPYITYNIRF
jgi:outer membrane receptor protein involved in Fe transport